MTLMVNFMYQNHVHKLTKFTLSLSVLTDNFPGGSGLASTRKNVSIKNFVGARDDASCFFRNDECQILLNSADV